MDEKKKKEFQEKKDKFLKKSEDDLNNILKDLKSDNSEDGVVIQIEINSILGDLNYRKG